MGPGTFDAGHEPTDFPSGLIEQPPDNCGEIDKNFSPLPVV